MSDPVSVTIIGDFMLPVNEMTAKLKDMRVPLEAFGAYLEKETREQRFDKEQTPDGTKWKELKPKYAAYKADKVGAQRKILEFNGNLKASITAQLQGKKKLLVGSVLEYAERQNEVREFLGVNTQDIQELKDTITDFLTGE